MQADKRKLRIVAMSDTHDMHSKIDIASLPQGDIFIHGGDFTKWSGTDQFSRFRQFLQLLPFKHKVVIPGNHDFGLDRVGYERSTKKKHQVNGLSQVNSQQEIEKIKQVCIYLQHQAVTVEGIKIFGSPYSIEYHDMGFAHNDSEEGVKLWEMMPSDTQVLVTHGPPYGIRDKNQNDKLCGSKTLLDKVLAVKPKLHIFGHIHECYGNEQQNGITFANVCQANVKYEIVNKPQVFDIQVNI